MGRNSATLKDSYNITLCGSFLLGLATMVPWNFFMTADDYWKYKFRDDNTTEVIDNSKLNETQKFFASYLSGACNGLFLVALFLNTIFNMKFSSNSRITGSLLGTTFAMLLTTAFVLVDTDSWKSEFLTLTLCVSGATSLFVAVSAGSSMGICGFLPERFMTANSLGQAVAGVLCAAAQIGCLLLRLSSQKTALLFFSIAVVTLMTTSVVWRIMRKTKFFNHYQYIASCSDTISVSDVPCMPYGRSQGSIWQIFRQGWEFHLAALLIPMLSVPIFPGLGYNGSSIHAERSSLLMKLFLPVACFFTFSLADVLGRYVENFFPYRASRRKLLVALCCIRVVLIPLLLVCNLSPSNRKLTPVLFESDTMFVLVMIISGFSNGYLLNVAFVNGPKSTELEYQERSATIIMCFYSTGATLGSLVGYFATLLL